MNLVMTRRHLLLRASTAVASMALAGCATSTPRLPVAETLPRIPDEVLGKYAALPLERFPIPAARIDLVDPMYWRQEVDNLTGEDPGTVVVDTPRRFLYWTLPDSRAIRYGIGIGRDGFAWGGRARIAYKKEWPRWTPPSEMIDRQPELEQYRHGMAPGLENPLGPRALYIHDEGGDTLYRLHGNMDARSIGKAVSSGCVRLLFQDVVDLYDRVPPGSPIVVIQ